MIFSTVLPLIRFEINLDLEKLNQSREQESFIDNRLTTNNQDIKPVFLVTEKPQIKVENKADKLDWNFYFIIGYLLVTIIFLVRFTVRIFLTIKLYFQSTRKKHTGYVHAMNNEIKHSFSFFRWIFTPTKLDDISEINQIIAHEKIHVTQNHSLDIILVELIAAVFWFNPAVWLLRKEIQLVHEYLADEGALSTGIDRLGYQALLVNQVAEERFVLLSSSFNHSLIKKRMIMMTKSKFNQGSKLKILALFPLSIILFLGVACVNGQKSNNESIVAAVSPTRMNVMYLGAENPVKIAVSGYKTSEIDVSVKENGSITGSNGEYIVRPKKRGSLIIVVKHSNKIIQETEFRVKTIPDPHAAVMLDYKAISSGNISKKELLKAEGIVAHMKNFDFDLHFNVESFVLSSTVPNSTTVREEISKSDKFSANQVELIKSLIKNQKLIVEDILISGPDGMKRKVSPMVFTISE